MYTGGRSESRDNRKDRQDGCCIVVRCGLKNAVNVALLPRGSARLDSKRYREKVIYFRAPVRLRRRGCCGVWDHAAEGKVRHRYARRWEEAMLAGRCVYNKREAEDVYSMDSRDMELAKQL